MSIKTTHRISRELAINIIMSKLMVADNNILEDMLESFPESYFRNYSIEPSPWPDCPEIKSIEQFNNNSPIDWHDYENS